MTTPDIDGFAGRHIGPSVDEQAKMLAVVGHGSRADLVDQAVPAAIHQTGLELPAAADEEAVLGELRALAGQNRVLRSMIGLGYFDTVTPPVIRRGVLEDPGWYTAYTPYQPEISQGRSRRCSTSRPWSPTSPACRSRTPPCSTSRPPPPRPCHFV